MATKLPFIQFFPDEYLRDTRGLSLAAKGGWVDILCALHHAPTRGEMSMPLVGWARLMGATADQAAAVIDEIDLLKVADVSRTVTGNSTVVTLVSRRMRRERIEREQAAERQRRHRDRTRDGTGDPPDPEPCHAGETDVSHARSQKPYTRNQSTSPKGEVARLPGLDDLPDGPVLPRALDTPEFRAAWAGYVDYRRRARMRKLLDESVEAQWRKMEKWGVEGAIESIGDTISNQWQGLFPPKNGHAQKPAKKGTYTHVFPDPDQQ